MIHNRKLRIFSIVLSLLLVLSTLIPSTTILQASNSINEVDLLKNLTDEQRETLTQLDTEKTFTIHPDINVDSDELIDVIVEFKQDPAKVEVIKQQASQKGKINSLSESEKRVEDSHEEFKQELNQITKTKTLDSESLSINREYRHAINGVAMTLQGNMIEELVQTGLVERVWKDEEVQLQLPVEQDNQIEPQMADSIPHIDVDQLHDEGIQGEGIEVGVIDTGIDYNHPDLDNAYKGYRSIEGEDPSEVDPEDVKGWDFIEDDADPMETTYEEWVETDHPEFDELGNSYYTAHGSHVSGTVAGGQDQNIEHDVKGIAPEADLYGYRVLGPYGSGDMNGVIAGIDKAVKDEMDVINLSLGSNENDPLAPTSVAVNNAMLSDVVTVVSSGNAGPEAQTVGDPGAAAFSISVGASDVSQTIPVFEAKAGEGTIEEVKLLGKNFTDDITELQGQSFEILDAGFGTEEDFTDLNIDDQLVLIERGEITFDEKFRNAKQAGAKIVIVYNDEEGQIEHYIGESTEYTPSFGVSKSDGEILKEYAGELDITFGELGDVKTVGDHLADFSSRGPVSQTYDIKPDIVAPGVDIYSTVPSYINDPEQGSYETAYARMQGTSMASPHVAGVAALVLQENSDYSSFDVKTALMNTSVDLQEDYSVYEVGAGRIHAYDAVTSETSIQVLDETEMLDEDEEMITIPNETASLSYGSHYFESGEDVTETKQVNMTNQSSEDESYELSVRFLDEEDDRKNGKENGVTVDVPDSLMIEAGQEKEFEAKLTVPSSAEYGTYEGYVQVINQENDISYQIPFAIRVTDKGISFWDLDRHAVPNEWTFHNWLTPFIGFQFQLKSPMETIDVIVTDYETDEPIGLVGTMDAKDFETDITYITLQGFMGHVNLFTGDPENPIDEELTHLDEDAYNLKFIATDEDKETYTLEELVAVDNTGPEMTFHDLEPGIHEVDDSMYTEEDGDYALWVHTNVYDDTVEFLQSEGLDYDQSDNLVGYFDDFGFPGILPVDESGEMKFGVLPEEVENGPYNLELIPVDMATNDGEREHYTFLEKGTTYGEVIYEDAEVLLGDELTLTLSLSNVENLKSGEFDLEYDRELYSFADVDVSDEFSEYVEAENIDVKLDEPQFSEELYTDIVHLGATLEGTNEGFSGNIDFLDVTFDVVGDEFYGDKAQVYHDAINEFNYQNTDEENVSSPVITHDTFHLISKHSTLYGHIAYEAFQHEDGFSVRAEYEELGATITAIAPDGTEYKGSIDDTAQYEIKGLPATDETYTVTAEMPGHLNSTFETTVAIEEEGELYGDNVRMDPDINKAGDINGDGVIDIMDVMRIVGLYGSDNEEADINKDGIVDETDIRYIEKNFLEVGPDTEDKQPQETLGIKDLNDFLESLGLEPADE